MQTGDEVALIVGRLRAAGCVFAEDEADLLVREAGTLAGLERMIGRRVGGEPLEYILGWVAFRGLRVAVEPGVFVPRRRSEFVVAQALEAGRASESPVVVDLCCGSGALGRAVAAAWPGALLAAADIDPVAVRCARLNLAGIGEVYEGDLFEPVPTQLRGSVTTLVVNAPYVPTEAIALMPPEARLHEARRALDGGSDGLDVQRRVAAAAPHWLAPGGHLVIETSRVQAERTEALFREAGLSARIAHSGEFDATVVIATLTR
ncbi:putative protein N(5)-glutamine methyltransferase [soil metagenome]